MAKKTGKAQLAASSQGETPAPFSTVSEKYSAFLKELDRSKVYIVHLDTLPRDFKRKLFLAPVVLNSAIAMFLLWRAATAYPLYVDMIFLVLGYNTNAKVDASTKTRRQLISIVIRRTLMMFMDFVLFRFLILWPLSFFLQAPANPVSWRWNVGFSDKEIAVRESRDWGQKDLFAGLAQGSESPFFKTRILPAIDPEFMKKTAYLMIRPDFDLSFHAMIHATRLVKKNILDFEDFQKTIFAYSDVHGWLGWRIHDLDKDSEEQARKKIVAFKDRLTDMGKESLFFRWVELVQYESSQPGEFTQERQEAAVQKVKALFEQQGVDFESFIESIGGIETLPSMVNVR